MKKLFRRIDSISTRMLLSYFSILLVPLCVILLIYSASMDTILISRQETAMAALEKTASNLSARMEELHNISAYIYAAPSVNAVINRSRFEPRSRNIAMVGQAIDALPNYKLTNRMIEDVFIFFVRADYVIKQPNAFAFTEANYDAHIYFHGLRYEDFLALCQNSPNGMLVTEDENGRDVLLLRSIPHSSSPEGLIVVRLNIAELNGIIEPNDTGPEGAAFIFTQNGDLLAHTGRTFSEIDSVLPPIASSAAYREIELNGERYLLCQVQENGLTYLTLTRRAYLLESIAPIKNLIILLGAAALLLGSVTCLSLWRKRSRVVRSITDTARSVGIDFEAAKNESGLLETTVTALASTVGTLRETMNRQHDALRQTVIQRCLNGAFTTRQEMLQEASSLNLDLSASWYHVVRVQMLSPGNLPAENTRLLPYRIFLKQFFAEHLPITHIACDIDGASFVLLLMEDQAYTTQSLVKLLHSLRNQVGRQDWAVPSFAISDGAMDLWEVSALNAQTEAISRYMTLLSRSGVMCIDHLPASEDMTHFPMDTELRLIQAMKGGSPDELASVFDDILEENLVQRSPNHAMLSELLEALRRSALRAVQESVNAAEVIAAADSLYTARSFAELRSCAALVQEQLYHSTKKQTREQNQQTRKMLQALMDENLSNPLFSLCMLSEMVGISESTLYRTFKDCFGVSFSGHLEQCRIIRAFELLKGNTLVKDVAAQVGYTSDHTFRRAFKRIMKVPPGQFAKLAHSDAQAPQLDAAPRP